MQRMKRFLKICFNTLWVATCFAPLLASADSGCVDPPTCEPPIIVYAPPISDGIDEYDYMCQAMGGCEKLLAFPLEMTPEWMAAMSSMPPTDWRFAVRNSKAFCKNASETCPVWRDRVIASVCARQPTPLGNAACQEAAEEERSVYECNNVQSCTN